MIEQKLYVLSLCATFSETFLILAYIQQDCINVHDCLCKVPVFWLDFNES
jgi:hypothetical protein